MADISFRDRATLLLSNLEEGREVRTYIQQFSRADEGCFAVIKVGGAIVAEQTAALGERLALLQALGLKPIVVFGAGPQLDERLADAGIPTERVDNLRVTSKAAIGLVAEESAATGLALGEAIAALGGNASLAPPSVVRGELIDEPTYGCVGNAVGIRQAAIDQMLAAGSIPLISCVGMDPDGQLLNINADDVAREVVLAVRPQKIVFLTGTGGLLDGDENIIDAINLVSDYDELMAAPWVHSGMALKLKMIHRLLAELPLSSSVSITTAPMLMKELFTHGGAGTLIRRGEAVHVTQTADPAALTPLIEEAFGRPLQKTFWDATSVDYVIHTERFRAAAVVSKLNGHDLLDKFAVGRDARGEGLAKTVWRYLQARSPQLIWRSRQDNPFNGFYLAMADGFIRRGPWLILWYGREADEDLLRDANELGARPADFEG